MNDTIKAWQCIGCGSIEARETCIGICEYRKAEFVPAAEHRHVLTELEATRTELGQLRRLVARLARVTPRPGAFETSYRAMQQQAQSLVQAPLAGSARTPPNDWQPAPQCPDTLPH